MNLFTLVATLGLDTSDFSKNIGSAVDQGKKLGSGLTKMLGVAGKTAAAIAVTTSTAYVSIVKKSADAVSELEQQMGGAEAVWGNYAHAIDSWAKEAYINAGLGVAEYTELSNAVGSILQGGGMSQRDAMLQTLDILQRGADLASVYGGTTADAVNSILSALRGETDPIEKYGLVVGDAALQHYALEKGISKAVSKMSYEQKQLLRLQMIFDESAHAQGNFAKETETLAGSAAVMKAAWANLLDGSGSPEAFGSQLVNYIDTYMDVLEDVAPRIAKSIGVVLSMLGDRTREWFDSVGGISGALSKGLNWTLGKLNLPDSATIVDQVTDWWNGLTGDNVYEKIKEGISIAVSKVDAPPLDDVVDNFTTWWRDTAVPAIETAMSTYAEEFAIPLIADVLNLSDEDAEALLTAYQELFGAIGENDSTVVSLIGEIVLAIGNLFSSGGEYEGSGIAKALTMLVQGFTGVTNAANTALTAIKDFFAYFNGRSASPSGTIGAGGLLFESVGSTVDTGPTFGEQVGQWAEGVWNDTRNLLGIPGRPGANNSPNITVVNNNISSVAQNPADIGFATQQSLNRLRFG